MTRNRIAFSITPSAAEWLRQTSQETGMSVSAIIRAAVRAHPTAKPREASTPRTERVQMWNVDDDIARTLRSSPEVKISDKMAGVLAAYRFAR